MSTRSRSKPDSAPAQPESFEAAIDELEKLVAAMESGQLALEASLASYERGLQLLRYCQGKLDSVEQRIQVLDNDALKPFAPAPDQDGGNA